MQAMERQAEFFGFMEKTVHDLMHTERLTCVSCFAEEERLMTEILEKLKYC